MQINIYRYRATAVSIVFAKIALIISIAACTSSYSPNEIIGHYTINKGYAKEELDILPNGEYIQRYMLSGYSPLRSVGVWRWEEINESKHLIFDGFRSWFNHELYNPQQSFDDFRTWYKAQLANPTSPFNLQSAAAVSVFAPDVYKTLGGEIRIIISDDDARFYVKNGSPCGRFKNDASCSK